MDLSPDQVHGRLDLVAVHGWDSAHGRQLLVDLRHAVVEPIVRRSGLRGPAADQAIATGWAAAWDALRRPSARTAANPVGLAWSAVRRAVWVEVVQGLGGPGGQRTVSLDLGTGDDLERAAAAGRSAGTAASGTGPSAGSAAPELGRHLEVIVEHLADLGWDRSLLVAAIEELAEQVAHDDAGTARARWRWVAHRVGLPDWQARRLAAALLGVPEHPGVLALVATYGPAALDDEGVRRVLRATCRRSLASPAANLTSWAGLSEWGSVQLPEGAGLCQRSA